MGVVWGSQESPVAAHLSVAPQGTGEAQNNWFALCCLSCCPAGFAAVKFKAVTGCLGVLQESRIEAAREKRQWGKGEDKMEGDKKSL